MSITAAILKQIIAEELETITDERVRAHIRSLLVEPAPILRDWDCGEPGEQYTCWAVLNHERSNTGIAYCEEGFGLKSPWGLVGLTKERGLSMGMDSGWFRTFMEAYFDSFAATDLSIWRVFKTNLGLSPVPISPELAWDKAWEQIMELRASDPETRYDCGHSIK